MESCVGKTINLILVRYIISKEFIWSGITHLTNQFYKDELDQI